MTGKMGSIDGAVTIAILDDYQNNRRCRWPMVISRGPGDHHGLQTIISPILTVWSNDFEPFDVVCVMRERTTVAAHDSIETPAPTEVIASTAGRKRLDRRHGKPPSEASAVAHTSYDSSPRSS